MSEQLTLSAETRERAGKGASRAMRREGRVPAVVYGNKEEPLAVHVEEKALMKMLGVDVGSPRLPNASLNSSQADELKAELEQAGFFDWIR